MLTTQSENFQKFEFEFLAGIWPNTWQANIEKNRVYCEHHCRRSSRPCSHARGDRRGRAQLPLPRPKLCDMGGNGGHRPDPPPSLLLLPLCKLPTTLTSPAPTHSNPRPRQHPSSTRARPSRPVSPVHAARAPALATFWPPLPSTSWAHKPPPPSIPRRSTHSPQPIPTLLSSSLPRRRPISVSVRRRVPGDSGRHWSCCWCEVEERSHRRRSATPPSSSASSPSCPCRRTLIPANAGEPCPSRGRQCLWAVRSRSVGRVPVRCVKWPDRWATLVRFKIRNLSRPGETVLGRPVWVSFEISPVHLEFGPISFI
jgi:hypothetical protein